MKYVNKLKDTICKTTNYYNDNYIFIKNNTLKFIHFKNYYINEINNHYDRIINLINNKKLDTISKLESFSKDKLSYYNSGLIRIEEKIDLLKNINSKVDLILNQKVLKEVPLVDELNFISTVEIDKVNDKELQSFLDKIIIEMKNDYLPKLTITKECIFIFF